jgi:L-ribulokinase
VPADYIEVLKRAVPDALADAGVDPAQVIGVGHDFTACTLVPVLEDGTPLNELPEYAGRRHAYVKLWKHHAAQQQADRINRLAAERDESWRARYGGLLSSEWSMAKGLQLLEEDREIYDRMWRYVEASDWLVWQLGGQFTRNTCTAGSRTTGRTRLPDKDFCHAERRLRRLLHREDRRPDRRAARSPPFTAEALPDRLPEGIPIAAGNVDAHVACPAVQAAELGQMTAIMGMSARQIVNDAVSTPCRACGWSTVASSTACTATRPGSPGWATSSPGSSRTPCRRRRSTPRRRPACRSTSI